VRGRGGGGGGVGEEKRDKGGERGGGGAGGWGKRSRQGLWYPTSWLGVYVGFKSNFCSQSALGVIA